MLITLKPLSFFWIMSIGAFALFCIAITSLSIWLKIALSIFVLWFVLHHFYYARKKMIRSIKLFESGQFYWMLTYATDQCFARLLPRKTYQSKYFICLFWQHVTLLSQITLKKNDQHALLCRWHYDAETWRALQACLTTYPMK